MDYKFLNSIHSPDDLRALPQESLQLLCEEIRDCIINTVSQNGGHLASNLGAVELTVALHRVFHSPEDAIIFDVGHQSYTHKLLTGRFDRFSTLRQEGGLSGFMRPQESEHDPFVTGHSSNSISAAYGIYCAKQCTGAPGTAIAVIGDGAMTGGLAYEALNNAGNASGGFIVVLNDNEMSISNNVGSVARAFARMRNRPRYHRFKSAVGGFLQRIPLIGKPLCSFVIRMKDVFKTVVYRNNVFAALGFNYLGPVDGHNIAETEALLRVAQEYHCPTVVHVVTKKGKGYSLAEQCPRDYHGVSPFDRKCGVADCSKANYSAVAGQTLCALAQDHPQICAVTAAMACGTGLSEFAGRFHDRFFDVGIAEEHAVTFSAGLASAGMIPFFAVYASFLQRGYDQLLHDAAIAGLPLKLLVDRAGIVGEDGESHQGIFDIPFLSTVPGLEIYAPSSFAELRICIEKAATNGKLTAIRYPRGGENSVFTGISAGDFVRFGESGKHAIVTYGRLFPEALVAQKELNDVDVFKLNRVHPLPEGLTECLSQYDSVDVFEECFRTGGIGEQLSAALSDGMQKVVCRIHAIDGFVPASTVPAALHRYGLDSAGMITSLKNGND